MAADAGGVRPRPAAGTRPAGRRRLKPSRSLLVGGAISACVLLVAILTPLAPLPDPFVHSIGERLHRPGPGHPLGTDQYGRELWLLVLAGGASAAVGGG